MKIDGQCHCGEITFEADADPDAVVLCHCTDCQRLTGTAFRASVIVPADTFRLLTGTPRGYIKTGESGNQRRHAFCGTCGSPIFACALENPPNYTLRLGAITQRRAFSPKRQIWRRSALDWVDDFKAVPAEERQ